MRQLKLDERMKVVFCVGESWDFIRENNVLSCERTKLGILDLEKR